MKVLRVFFDGASFHRQHAVWWYLDALKYLRSAIDSRGMVHLVLYADEPQYSRENNRRVGLTPIIRQGYLWVEYRDNDNPRKPTWVFDAGDGQYESETNGNVFAHLIRLFANELPNEEVKPPATRYEMLRKPL